MLKGTFSLDMAQPLILKLKEVLQNDANNAVPDYGRHIRPRCHGLSPTSFGCIDSTICLRDADGLCSYYADAQASPPSLCVSNIYEPLKPHLQSK